MAPGFATVTVEDGVSARWADVDGFTVAELGFPSGYAQARFEPELPYLAVVLDGEVEKSFARRRMRLRRRSAVTMPAGATHSARFGPRGARIAIVKPRAVSDPAAQHLARLDEVGGASLEWLGRRLTDELRASDDVAPLAAEGFALELLATGTRQVRRDRTVRPPRWLRDAEEVLRTRIAEPVGLRQLAAAVGVRPSELARAFRMHRGVSVGEYGRRLRIEWAAGEIAGRERPLAEIAVEAGFADQSHFTRVFKRYVGTTPARYRGCTHVPRP